LIALVRSAGHRLRFALPALSIAALLALLPFPTCILRLIAGIPCPACGLTRAALAIAALDFAAATAFHPLSLPLCLAASATVIGAATLDDRRFRMFLQNMGAGVGIALVVVWVLRFGGLFGGPVPP